MSGDWDMSGDWVGEAGDGEVWEWQGQVNNGQFSEWQAQGDWNGGVDGSNGGSFGSLHFRLSRCNFQIGGFVSTCRHIGTTSSLYYSQSHH